MGYAQANLSERMESVFPTVLDLNETLPSNGQITVARDFLHRIGAEEGLVGTYDNELAVYSRKSGVWEVVPRDVLKAQFRRYDGCSYLDAAGKERRLKASATWVNGATNSAIGDSTLVVESFFREAPEGVQFTNGFLRLRSGEAELLPKSPDHGALWGLSYDYDARAECPQWKALLRKVFDGSDVDAKTITFQRFLGACVFRRATSHQQCLILHGESSAATNALLDIVTRTLFDERVVTRIDPNDWSKEFELAKLSRSVINVVSAMPKLVLKPPFKSVITGDLLSARFPHQPVFCFKPQAGHIFVCEQMPSGKDMDYAYRRRLLPMTINERLGEQWDHSHRYEDVVGQIVSSEAPGIMAWAVRGAEKMDKSVTYGPFADAANKRWRQC